MTMAEASGLYSPSDDSEGPVLRDFVNETLAHELDRPENSPRSELLSTIHGPATSYGSQATAGHRQDSRPRRGPSQRYRRERESAYKGFDQRELLRLLIEHEYEASKMRKTLYMVFSQLEGETQRATEAETQVKTYNDRFQLLNAERIAAKRESHTLEVELTQYKEQYNFAQKEIAKARETVLALRSQLDAAEQVAQKARGDARKVKEVLEIWKAREEGRRQGFEAGWNRAREEFGIVNDQPVLGYESHNLPPTEVLSFSRADVHGPGIGEDTISFRSYPPPEQRVLIPFPEVPVPPPPTSTVDDFPEFQGMPESTLKRSSDEHHPQHPVSTQSSSRPPSPKPGLATPAVQLYSLPIPPASEVEFANRPPSVLQSRMQPQPWFAESSIPRVSSPRPPDNFIPAASEDGHISLPPPHELAEYPPSPQPSINALPIHNAYSSRGAGLDKGHQQEHTSSKGKARATDSWYNQHSEVDSHTQIPAAAVKTRVLQPEPSTSWYQVRSPGDQSRRGTMNSLYSANSSGGLLDAWGYPIQTEIKRSGGLGTTLKNLLRGKGKDHRVLGMIKENALSRQGSLNVGVPAPLPSRPLKESTYPRTSISSVPNAANNRFVDELRYDDSNTARERDPPHEDITSSKDRPPRNVRIPAHLTVPGLLSTQQPKQKGVRHERVTSFDSADPRLHEKFGNSTPSQIVSNGTGSGRQNSRNAARNASDLLSDPLSGHHVDLISPPVSTSFQSPSQSPSDTPIGSNSTSKAPSASDGARARSASFNQGSYRSPVVLPTNSPSKSRKNWPSLPQSHRAVSPSFSNRDKHSKGESRILNQGSSRPSKPSEVLPNPYQRSARVSSNQNSVSYQGDDMMQRSSQIQQSPSPEGHKQFQSHEITGAPVSFTNSPLPSLPAGHTQFISTEGRPGLKRVSSNLSGRSAGSQYSHFVPETYRDPAYFSLDTD